jgi:hypothetical protein
MVNSREAGLRINQPLRSPKAGSNAPSALNVFLLPNT